jgi:predicted metalloprotease with PDZ domain
VSHGLLCQEKVLSETGDRQRVVAAGTALPAGLKAGDEILTVGAQRVANRFDVERALWDRQPGEKVALQVRRAASELTLTLTLAPGDTQAALAPTRPVTERLPVASSTGVALSHQP